MSSESLSEIIAAGKELGYTDQELKDYVKEQQDRLRDERILLREREKDERAYRLELERLDQAVKLKEIESKHELEMKMSQGNVKSVDTDSGIKARMPKISPFDERHDEMDSYLRRFERYATVQHWERNTWATSLSALLCGKALDVYALMSSETAQNYDELKSALLRRYDLTEDGFKRKFRSSRPEPGETFSQFTVRLGSYLTRWIEMSKIPRTVDGLFDLMLRDQILHVCNQELTTFLRQNVPKTADELCKLADQFSES